MHPWNTWPHSRVAETFPEDAPTLTASHHGTFDSPGTALPERKANPLTQVLQQRVPLVIKGQATEQFSHQCRRSPEHEGQLWRLQVTLGGTKHLRAWPGIGAKHTEWKGKFSPARGHHRPWRCEFEHRKEPAFNRGCQIKIPAPLFPASKMSDAVLPSPLHASWPFLFQQRGNSTHPTIEIILRLALPSSTPQKSCDTAEPDHNQHLKSLGSACIYGGEGDRSVLIQNKSECALRHRARDSCPVSQFC